MHERYESKINKHEQGEQLKSFLYIEIFPSWLTIRIVYTVNSISSIDSRENFPQTTICYRNIVNFEDQIFILRNDIFSDKRTIERNNQSMWEFQNMQSNSNVYHSFIIHVSCAIMQKKIWKIRSLNLKNFLRNSKYWGTKFEL